MLIGELSRKTGLTRDTIRFYEKQGLISFEERRSNSYKEYSEGTMNKLLTIKKLKKFGFTLNEAFEILETTSNETVSCGKVSQELAEKTRLIDQKIAELVKVREYISKSVNNCCTSSTADCTLFTADPNEGYAL